MPGLFAYEEQLEKINAHQPPLYKLNQVIDWELFREPVENMYRVFSKFKKSLYLYFNKINSNLIFIKKYYKNTTKNIETRTILFTYRTQITKTWANLLYFKRYF